MRTSLFALLMLVSPMAGADNPTPNESKPAPGPPVIKDAFGFDYMKPKKSTCAKVSGALAKKLAVYSCEASPSGTTASQRDAVADCKNKKGDSGFRAGHRAAGISVRARQESAGPTRSRALRILRTAATRARVL